MFVEKAIRFSILIFKMGMLFVPDIAGCLPNSYLSPFLTKEPQFFSERNVPMYIYSPFQSPLQVEV
jgi:hypothetical protein